MTGAGVSASGWGLPDLGLLTLTDMAEHARVLVGLLEVPLIADADAACGSPINSTRVLLAVGRVGERLLGVARTAEIWSGAAVFGGAPRWGVSAIARGSVAGLRRFESPGVRPVEVSLASAESPRSGSSQRGSRNSSRRSLNLFEHVLDCHVEPAAAVLGVRA